jgi:guanyl-specific ribonuclease Sa
MASNHNHGSDRRSDGGSQGSAARRRAPEWADGLKQLYDSVVQEDLPDNFKDLLDQLDEGGPSPGSNDNAGPSSGKRS